MLDMYVAKKYNESLIIINEWRLIIGRNGNSNSSQDVARLEFIRLEFEEKKYKNVLLLESFSLFLFLRWLKFEKISQIKNNVPLFSCSFILNYRLINERD